MPYVRSNWEGLTQFNGGGKFEAGQVHSLTEVKLGRPAKAGPRGCFLHVTMESEARVSYLEMVISAKAIEIYILKGGQGASGEYAYVGRLEGRPAMDHPFKYHYKLSSAELPDERVALLQLRLTPHQEGAMEVYLFRFAVMVGDVNMRHKPNVAASINMAQSMQAGGSVSHLPGGESLSLVARSNHHGHGHGHSHTHTHHHQQQLATRNNANQVALTGPGNGGEAAVVADALNDVMGKMLTVVTKKTKGYVGSTYKKTEDKIAARMRSMEAKITGFEKVVGQNLERRLLDLEHVMATLNERIDTQTQIHEEEEVVEEVVTGAGGVRRESSGSVESSGGSGSGSMSGSGGSLESAASSFYDGGVEEMKGGEREGYRAPVQHRGAVVGV